MSFRWKVVGLLCCVCVSVCGAPADDVSRKSVLELLEDLKVTCSENPFLTDSMSDDTMFARCAKPAAKLEIPDLNCLTYLDVNRRLCDLGGIAAFNWSERVRTAQSKELTVDLVCDPTTSITFTDLVEYPTYKKTIEKVFFNKILCLKLCLLKNEDVSDVSVNNFCKVLYYGTAIIEGVKKDSGDVSVSHVTPLKLLEPPIENVITASRFNKKETTKYVEEQSVIKDNVLAEKSSSRIHQEASLIGSPQKTSIKNKQQQQTTTTDQPIQQQQSKATLKKQEEHDSTPNLIENLKKGKQLSKPAEHTKQVETNEMKPPTVDQESSKTLQEEKLRNKLTHALSNKKTVKDQDEDQNPDDVSTLEDDSYDADDDARMINQGGAGDVPPQLEEDDIPKKKIETTRQEQISVDKELAAAYVPPEYDEDDDDGSFVPLFFFGVFSMVLLYILYHNKNKIMGLMIEGRQGRRRNSRGHAYRRLDTLEQAISANPTTTPSKIIY